MNRRAFTLVELLAATALSAALMTAGFGILRSLGRRPAASPAFDAWSVPLASLLRADCAHALVFQVDDDAVTLAGLNALDDATFEATHRPATVTYRITTIAGTRWLVREQASLDRSSPPGVDLVCAKATRVRAVLPPLTRARASSNEAAATLANDRSLPMLFRQLSGFRRVPERWQLVVDFDGRPSVTIVEAP